MDGQMVPLGSRFCATWFFTAAMYSVADLYRGAPGTRPHFLIRDFRLLVPTDQRFKSYTCLTTSGHVARGTQPTDGQNHKFSAPPLLGFALSATDVPVETTNRSEFSNNWGIPLVWVEFNLPMNVIICQGEHCMH